MFATRARDAAAARAIGRVERAVERLGRRSPPSPRLLALAGTLDRLGRRWERKKERVPLRVDLHPAARRERLSQHPPVLGERLLVRLRAQIVQQARGTLDVGEEQGDGAGRKLVRHEP